jgi:uncharacterized phage protein (TIGR02218 family)
MTFDAYESSVQLGAPVELYEFASGAERYRYTSADHNVPYGGDNYEAYPIQRDAIEVSAEKGKNNIAIRSQRSLPVADMYRVQPPSEVVTLTISRFHEQDPDSERVVLWMGRILNVKWEQTSRVVIHCEPVSSSLSRPGLRRLFQRQCPHVLYGEKCGVNKLDYQETATIIAKSGTTLSATEFDAFPDGWFDGGFFEFDLDNGNVERRFIASHVGDEIVMSLPSSDVVVGTAVRAYPGCDHSLGAGGCAKYSNEPNYGGQPYIPQKDPTKGSMF